MRSSRWSPTSWLPTGSCRARWTHGWRPQWRRPWPPRLTRRVSRRLFGVLLTAASLLVGCGDAHTPRELAVGAGTDPESTVLAELCAAALRHYGSPTRVAHVADPLAALDRGEVNVIGGFTGDVLQMFAPGTENVISDQNVYRAMVAALPEGVAA